MKILAATALILQLALTPTAVVGSVDAAEARAAQENTTSILPNSESRRSTELDGQTPVASGLDLSLFGIISLGVLGLFWIRRHTSEL
jgi:hypothetical protein